MIVVSTPDEHVRARAHTTRAVTSARRLLRRRRVPLQAMRVRILFARRRRPLSRLDIQPQADLKKANDAEEEEMPGDIGLLSPPISGGGGTTKIVKGRFGTRLAPDTME